MFVQFVDMGQKAAQSRGHLLYIGLYRENINTYFIWNLKIYSFDIWCKASASGPLPSY